MDFTVFKGLYFYRPTAENDSGNSGLGLFITAYGDGILIEDCLFLKCPIEFTGPGSGFNYLGYITNACLRRSGSTQAVSFGNGTGMHSDKVTGMVVEDNVIDMGGWAPGGRGTGNPASSTASNFKHNLYLTVENKNPLVRRNLLSRASAFAAVTRGGGTYTDNAFCDNPAGLGMNHNDLTSYDNGGIYAVNRTNLECIVTGNLFSGTTSVQGATVPGGGVPMQFVSIYVGSTHLVQNNLSVSGQHASYVGGGLTPIRMITDTTTRKDLFASFAANTTDRSSNGTNTGDVATTVNASTITYDNNLIARWGSNPYNATLGNEGTDFARNSLTRTNNVWSTEAASGSNVTFASVSGGYLAPTRDIDAYAAANGYASADALYDYAALHPEVNWAINIRNWVFAGYNR